MLAGRLAAGMSLTRSSINHLELQRQECDNAAPTGHRHVVIQLCIIVELVTVGSVLASGSNWIFSSIDAALSSFPQGISRTACWVPLGSDAMAVLALPGLARAYALQGDALRSRAAY